MFRKILYPTDFSEGSMRAIAKFEKMNSMEVGECILLHVIDEGTIEDMFQGYSLVFKDENMEIENLKRKLTEESRKKLENRVRKCKDFLKTDKIKTIVRIGIPYEEIVKVAEEENVSLILMPSHGKLGLSHELIGSTTMRVLRKTKKPILIIKTYGEE